MAIGTRTTSAAAVSVRLARHCGSPAWTSAHKAPGLASSPTTIASRSHPRSASARSARIWKASARLAASFTAIAASISSRWRAAPFGVVGGRMFWVPELIAFDSELV